MPRVIVEISTVDDDGEANETIRSFVIERNSEEGRRLTRLHIACDICETLRESFDISEEQSYPIVESE